MSNTKDIEQKLLRSELDVGIVEGKSLSPDLTVLPIIDDCLVLAVERIIHFMGKNAFKYRILWGNLLLCVNREAEPGSCLRYAAKHHIFVQTVWEANSPRALLNAVLYDRVLAVMSLRLMPHEIRHGKNQGFYNQNGNGTENSNLFITKQVSLSHS